MSTGWKVGLIFGLLLGAFAGGWFTARAQSERQVIAAADAERIVRHSRDSANAVHEREIARRDSIDAALTDHVAAIEKARLAEHAIRVGAELGTAEADLALGQAQTAVDSFPIYRDRLTPALRTENASLKREIALTVIEKDSLTKGWDNAKAKAGELVAMLHSDTIAIRADSVWHAKAAAVPRLELSFWPKIGNAVETVAIGTVTADACRRALLSVSCLVGTAVTARRLLK